MVYRGKHAAFQRKVWNYYRLYGRHSLPWRQADVAGHFDGYKVVVSEMMLQQTQVPRVIPKFQEFIARFPDFRSLATASLGDVMKVWNGLGYNRRAKYLWQLSQAVMQEYQGQLPSEIKQLMALPGIGPNTAGAIRAYVFNLPDLFIETNIRTVFIHHFFPDRSGIGDQDLLPLVEATLDTQNPREWYWALMDYGTFLKAEFGNVARASRHFTKQSRFEGSKRQLRGRILRQLIIQPSTAQELQVALGDERLPKILNDLLGEGLVKRGRTHYSLP